MISNNGFNDPDRGRPHFQRRSSHLGTVSILSTNPARSNHPFLGREIEEEPSLESSQIVPKSNSSLSSASSTRPMELDLTQVIEPSQLEFFNLRVHVPIKREQLVANEIKESLMAPVFEVEYTTTRAEAGVYPYTDMSIQVGWRKEPETLVWDAVRTLFAIQSRPRLILDDDKLFSTELSVSMAAPLNAVNFCSRTADGDFLTHWTVSYMESNNSLTDACRNNFEAHFHFALKSLNIHCWNTTDKTDLLSFGLVQIDLNCIRNVTVAPWLSDGRIQIILEVEHPVTFKRKRVPVDKLRSLDPYRREKAYALPDKLTNTLDRGQWHDEHPAAGILSDCRHIELDMSISKSKCYELLSRLHHTTKADVVFEMFENQIMLMLAEYRPFLYWMPAGTEPFNDPEYLSYLNRNVDNEEEKIILTLRMKALAGMNISTKNQLLSERNTYVDFYQTMITDAQEHFKNCIALLEAMILCLERTSRPASLLDIYLQFRKMQREGHLPYGRVLEPEQHYENAEMIEITPSGIHFKLPELHNGNLVSRYLRRRGKRAMIRATLRTEDGEKLRWTLKNTDNNGEQFICKELRDMIRGIMMRGVEILGVRYSFFASSSSQMTELGMFLMDSRDHDELRDILGKYIDENPHKNLAREGQCTSQSMECPIPIEPDMWDIEKDKPLVGFCKTDGAGRISLDLMEEISQAMRIWPCVPEGFQFRFLCFKGMLFVDRTMKGRRIMFRQSQKKYDYGSDLNLPLQIIKFTGPQTANLCASFINIVDQNAERQGAGQERIRETILDLNEKNFKDLAEASVEEGAFRAYLKKLPFFVDLDDLSEEKGFYLCQEPFFASLFACSAKRAIDLAIDKNRIPLDPAIARSLHGAPDDIGLLEEDEVYIETTVNVNYKYPGPASPSVVWKGKVLLWKNPLGHPGDVRVVNCVNRPEYNGQVNKLVFSKNGVRPLFDMLSGSDLDGDEYGACLLEDIMPHSNEEPMDYTAGKPVTRQFGRTKQERRVETYLHCAQNNSTGMVSIAHLVKSDEHGLHTDISHKLAKMACLSLDMPKSGIISGPLSRKWITLINGTVLPPEFPNRRPDFKAVPQKGATYRSLRLNGILNRLNRQLLFISSAKNTSLHIKVNPIMEELMRQYRRRDPRGMAALEAEIEEEYECYSKEILEIINSLKLSCSPEAELFSGCHLSGKSKKDNEYSNVNTKDIGLNLAIGVFRKYRQYFFNQFHEGGYLMATHCRNPLADTDDVLERTFVELTEGMKRKAVVSYVVCYRNAAMAAQPVLTYGWIGYDVLAFLQNSFNHSNVDFGVEDESFLKKLEEKMVTVSTKYPEEYGQMEEEIFYDKFLLEWIFDLGSIYGETVKTVLFCFVNWANTFGLVDPQLASYTSDVSRFLWVVLSLGYGSVAGFDRLFSRTSNLGIGKMCIGLFAGLASRQLVKTTELAVCELGEDGTATVVGSIGKEEIRLIHETARKCYYHLLINRDFDLFDSQGSWCEVNERDARIIELPINADLNLCVKKLTRKTGAESLFLQRKDNYSNRVIVLYRGSWETEERLREIVEVPPLVSPLSDQEQEDYYAREVLSSIVA